MPVQPSEIRASGETHVISVITRPAPPSARVPRCVRWKSVGVPSTAEYMSIGATTTRLTTVMSRRRYGVNIGGGGLDGPDGRGRSDAVELTAAGRSRALNHRST